MVLSEKRMQSATTAREKVSGFAEEKFVGIKTSVKYSL